MRHQKLTVLTAVVAAALGTALLAQQQAPGQYEGQKLEITAFAVNMSNIATGAAGTVQIRVDSWSTPDERTTLIQTMMEKKGSALLKVLQKLPVRGRFSIPGLRGPDPHHLRLGLDLHYAWQTAGADGGTRIVIATDRYIGFEEARNQPRTIDYPFTLFELRVDKNGEGEGKVSVATKISFDKEKKIIELENYSSEPVRLNNVKVKVRT